jgi:hypothetical protein
VVLLGGAVLAIHGAILAHVRDARAERAGRC